MAPKTCLASLVVLAILTLTGGTKIAHAQGSGSSRTDPQRATRPQTPEEFYSSFWRFIAKKHAAYNTWKVLTTKQADEAVENPHGKTSRTYADKTAASDSENLPIGSILVREDHDEKGIRQSISVMYRVKDYDKDHGNWYWLRFLEIGLVARGPENKAVAGKVSSCIECHAKAKDNDFVFSNDGHGATAPTNNASPIRNRKSSDTKNGDQE